MTIFKRHILIFVLLLAKPVFSQSNLDKLLKGGEIIVNGLTVLKGTKSNLSATNNSTTVESICVKNKLQDKITFKLAGKDNEGNEVKKELVIPKEGKECTYNLAKGVWAYEIVLSNKEIFKKGEYKIEDEIVITIKDE